MAEGALCVAWNALRRWEAVPPEALSGEQREAAKSAKEELLLYRRMLSAAMNKHNSSHNRPPDTTVNDIVDMRPWSSLSRAERLDDRFCGFVSGPLPSGHVYDCENKKLLDYKDGQMVLTMEMVLVQLKASIAAVRVVVREGEDEVRNAAPSRATSSDEEPPTPHTAHTGDTAHTGGHTGREGIYISARKFAQVDRLPWKTVRRMTRVIQMCWLGLGIVQTVQYFGVFQIDFVVVPEEEERRRRLYATPSDVEGLVEALATIADAALPAPKVLVGPPAPALHLESVEVAWPFGVYFSLASLACLPGLAGSSPRILVGSPSARYQLQGLWPDAGASSLRVAALARGAFPANAVAICAAPQPDVQAEGSCLWAALEPDGRALALWPFGRSRKTAHVTTLPFAGSAVAANPWRRFTGAIVPCRAVEWLLTPPDAAREMAPERCMLLAGWDGRRLPVAAVPLPPSAPGSILQPAGDTSVVFDFDAPLPPTQPRPRRAASQASREALEDRGDEEVLTALHIDARSGRLWAALADGELHAWDLLALRRLGRWQLQRRPAVAAAATGSVGDSAPVRAAALCEDPTGDPGRLLVAVAGDAGSPTSSAGVGPALLWVEWPTVARPT